VLFVDYMAEHLNPGGRAGLIVPEGIIFQSQNAYKALRKMLMENYLWAVVSLPAGVFNPYSGVKTSILFLDRNLARRTDELLFVKVESDGFDLGAQRRPNGKNDLPEALEILDSHKKAQKTQESKKALTVSRKRLLESGDINLSGDRYREAAAVQSKWPMVGLGEVCSLEYGSSLPERNRVSGPFPVVGSNGIAGFHKDFTVKGPAIVVGRKGSAGEVTWIDQDCVPIDTTYYVCIKQEGVLLRYLFYILVGLRLTELRGGAGVPGLNRNDAYDKEIPLPPLEEQERIVTELDSYRKVIEGARQVIANYKPTIKIDLTWPIKPLGDIASLEYGLTASAKDEGRARFIRITDITQDGRLSESAVKFIDLSDEAKPYLLKHNDVLVARTGATYGKTLLFDSNETAVFASYLIRIRLTTAVLPGYYWAFAQTDTYWEQAKSLVSGGGQPQFNGNALKNISVPLPPLDIQRQIVADLEAERALVEANRKLIARFEQKLQAKLAEIWGEETIDSNRADPKTGDKHG
ncbi:MAG: restriction endonuclease subunit S, partial [Deltaproteobacteria bacterium]